MTSSPTTPSSPPSNVASAPTLFTCRLWSGPNPPPPAIIPPFETEKQIRSHRLACRLAFIVLAIDIILVFLAGFDLELPRWVVPIGNIFYGPAMISWLSKKEREKRRKIQAMEALDEELGAVEDAEERRATL